MQAVHQSTVVLVWLGELQKERRNEPLHRKSERTRMCPWYGYSLMQAVCHTLPQSPTGCHQTPFIPTWHPVSFNLKHVLNPPHHPLPGPVSRPPACAPLVRGTGRPGALQTALCRSA